MAVIFGHAFILQILLFATTDALLCYNCTNLADSTECLTLSQCDAGHSCYMDFRSADQRSTLGCIDNTKCGVSVGGSLIGRNVNERQVSQDCHECCSTDKCNKVLCSHNKPTDCVDDIKVDCAFMNSFMNVCSDVQRAKVICPKFCSLCSLVDGAWSDWSGWSICDASCGNGIQTRLRTCDNPAPANGGLDCVGPNTDQMTCSQGLCPVNGGWSQWSLWGTCSVICGIGLEKRRRNCSNPLPERNGHPCFGDAMDVRICSPGPCGHGGWSSWGHWGTCSATCGDGLQKRSRSCTNPKPSLLAQYCEGDASQVRMCNYMSCNGGWSSWGLWSTCSATCDDGLRTRSRSCTNPRPPLYGGNNCEGDPTQVKTCSYGSCTPNIAFKAYNVRDDTPSANQTMVLDKVIFNQGNAYSTSTGIFTAPVNGTYFFTTQFCTQEKHFFNYVIRVDGYIYATGKTYADNFFPCNTADTVAVLHTNSKVWVECTFVTPGLQMRQDAIHMNTFSGYLVHR